MDSSELCDKVAELEREAGGKVLRVKFRVQVGDHVVVLDLEPEMLVLGSGSEPAVILLDLT